MAEQVCRALNWQALGISGVPLLSCNNPKIYTKSASTTIEQPIFKQLESLSVNGIFYKNKSGEKSHILKYTDDITQGIQSFHQKNICTLIESSLQNK